MGISFSQELSLAERNSYAKLTFDTSKLKKPEKIREDYGIPSRESIIGYMRNTNLFSS